MRRATYLIEQGVNLQANVGTIDCVAPVDPE
jgi:hypothetical protein